jgi:hypothetical protein
MSAPGLQAALQVPYSPGYNHSDRAQRGVRAWALRRPLVVALGDSSGY